MSQRQYIWILIMLLAYITAGCSSPKGIGLVEKQNFIRQMRDNTLQDLYSEKLEAKKKLEKAAGYGVFSNANVNVIFASVGDGYGKIALQ